jgi:hypothetical protein
MILESVVAGAALYRPLRISKKADEAAAILRVHVIAKHLVFYFPPGQMVASSTRASCTILQTESIVAKDPPRCPN